MTSTIPSELTEHINSHLDAVARPDGMAALANKLVAELLRRDEDQLLRDRTTQRVSQYFAGLSQRDAATDELLREARNFIAELVVIIFQIRQTRNLPPMDLAEIDRVYASLDDITGDIRGQAAEPTYIIIVPPPEAELHDSFEAMLPAALRFKTASILGYFQRRNPRVVRKMKLPFLLSGSFAAAFDRVVASEVVPQLLQMRSIRHIGSLYRWDELTSASFWQVIERDGHLPALLRAWHDAWDLFRPQRVEKKTKDGVKTVLRVGPHLQALRDALAGSDYVLPEIRGKEIDLFASLIEPDCSRSDLEHAWTRLRQLYEQELDRRFYQDKARVGALRDSLLECFLPFSSRTAEFLALLCYRNFPYLTLGFLLSFTHNHGHNEAERKKRIPFLMWFLDLPEADHALDADERWIAQRQQRDELRLRTEAETAEQARLAEMGAVVW